jgi:hypothetical protein
MLVVMLPAKISYLLFAAALKLFEELQPDPADLAARCGLVFGRSYRMRAFRCRFRPSVIC